jgi:EAL domain-containing protein (putative c-di-GMP-specific phosphodiesterase class I)
MQVTVEGVQTAQEESLVASLGADHAQGSYYSTPMTPADASDFFRRS